MQRKEEILPYLDRLRVEAGVPILYVSHALDEVARLADTLVLVSEGRVAAAGPIAELMARIDLGPLTGRAEAGSILPAIVTGQHEAYRLTELSVLGQPFLVPRVDTAAGTPVRLRVRARDVAVATRVPEELSIRNHLFGRIASVRSEPGAFAELRDRPRRPAAARAADAPCRRRAGPRPRQARRGADQGRRGRAPAARPRRLKAGRRAAGAEPWKRGFRGRGRAIAL